MNSVSLFIKIYKKFMFTSKIYEKCFKRSIVIEGCIESRDISLIFHFFDRFKNYVTLMVALNTWTFSRSMMLIVKSTETIERGLGQRDRDRRTRCVPCRYLLREQRGSLSPN